MWYDNTKELESLMPKVLESLTKLGACRLPTESNPLLMYDYHIQNEREDFEWIIFNLRFVECNCANKKPGNLCNISLVELMNTDTLAKQYPYKLIIDRLLKTEPTVNRPQSFIDAVKQVYYDMV